MTSTQHTPALRTEDLRVSFPGPEGPVEVVRGVSLEVARGERVAIVGESGSGKTMMGLSMLGITPAQAQVSGRVLVGGTDMVSASPATLRRMRGGAVSMVFQDALSSLNPVRTIGSQLTESVRRHNSMSRRAARERVLEMLDAVGVPAPAERFGAYPHQLSGGLRQRAMIALALVNSPLLVIADEPTTALDATIQAQVLDVLRSGLSGAALLLITHDLAVAARVCDRVSVVYAGRVVEYGPVEELLQNPRHPYTLGLIGAVPRFDPGRADLRPIPGNPPTPGSGGHGCWFAPRCDFVQDDCLTNDPMLLERTRAACRHPREGVSA